MNNRVTALLALAVTMASMSKDKFSFFHLLCGGEGYKNIQHRSQRKLRKARRKNERRR